MKKLIVTTVISVVLGMPNLALGNDIYIRNDVGSFGNGLDSIEFGKLGGGYGASSHYHPREQRYSSHNSDSKPSSPNHSNSRSSSNGITINNITVEQLDVSKKQLRQLEKMYASIMAASSANKAKKGDNNSLFFKNPQSIYDKNKQAEVANSISDLFKVVEEKNNFHNDSANVMRESINERSKYAAEMDQTVSLQAFKETENRFKKIEELLKQVDKTSNLKDAADLQARIIGTLTMIQNEATKLQMILHQRNAEKILINQQKLTRNAKILNSKNMKMPAIRYKRST
ncbi:type IV secretion system protein [Bartonella sp. B17]